jgi:hypothetical protein
MWNSKWQFEPAEIIGLLVRVERDTPAAPWWRAEGNALDSAGSNHGIRWFEIRGRRQSVKSPALVD